MGLSAVIELIIIVGLVYMTVLIQAKIFKNVSGLNIYYSCRFGSDEVFEGEETSFIETISNKKAIPVPWIRAEINTSKWLSFSGLKSVEAQESNFITSSFVLKSRQKITRRWNVKCLKRGVYKIDDVILVWGDLFGLMSNSKYAGTDAEIIVYPQIIELDDIAPNIDSIMGEVIVKRWVNHDPFIVAGVKEYSSYDSMKDIHWNATAKMGKLMVRKYDFTSQPSFTILLNIQSQENDFVEAANKDVIEKGIKVAATLVDKSAALGIPVQLAANGFMVDEEEQMLYSSKGLGSEHYRSLLVSLAKLNLKVAESFDKLVSNVAENIHDTNVAVITAFMNDEIYDAVIQMRQNGSKVTIIPLDNIDERYL